MNNLILITNWEKVDKTDFYLTDKWKENEDIKNMKHARKLQKENDLYYAYIVDAVSYAVYREMEAEQVLINSDADIIIRCESNVIGNNYKHCEVYKE